MKKFDNLDDYFAQARNEEPVFNKEQASALIDKFTRENLSLTPNKINIKKLFSKKGVKTMTWFSAAAIAGITAFSLLLPDSINQTKENVTNPSQSIVLQSKADDKQSSPIDEGAEPSFSRIENTPILSENQPKLNVLDDDNFQSTEDLPSSFQQVNGVNIIYASPSQIKELGIEVNNMNNTIKLAFFKNNPMIATIGENAQNTDITFLENSGAHSKYLPKLVTDYKGVRKIIAFEEDNRSLIQAYGNKSVDLKSLMFKNRGINNDSINQIDLDVKIAKADSIIKKIEVKSYDEMDSNMKKDFYNSIIMKCTSTLNDSVNTCNPTIVTNGSEEAQVYTFKVENNEEAQKLLSIINCDTTQKKRSPMKVIYRQIDYQSDDQDIFGTNAYLQNLRRKPIDINEMQKEMDKHFQINTLIPVFIPNPTETDPDYGYLVWYEATPEFLKILPQNIKKEISEESQKLENSSDICEIPKAGGEYFDVWRACSGAVEHLKAFPNPCNTNLNIKFNLTEKRLLSISLHDLAGNKIALLSGSRLFEQGEFNTKFDLSLYPSGMYLIVIQTDSGEQAVQRIIKE